MNAYFFKMNQAEKNAILDQHKQVYDGFVTSYGQNINQQPLYVQDFANDKMGITVNNKGEVKTYTNMRINEMRHDGMDTGLFSEEEDQYTYVTPTEEYESIYEIELDEDETKEMDYKFEEDLKPKFNKNKSIPEVDEDLEEPLQEQLNKTLDMFKKFNRY
jgi:hypothetical protein